MIRARPLLLLLLAFALPQPAGAAGTVQKSLTVESPALGRALAYSLYLPEGYEDGGGRRYPVLYLLHGYGGGEKDWLGAGAIAATLDRLIAEGALPPVVAVMPGAGNAWYVDGRSGEAMESALMDDLIPAVEARWGGDGRRAVAGLSMGGYGALRLAAFHPGSFLAAASLSGAIFESGAAAAEAGDFQLRLFGAVFGAPYDPAFYDSLNIWPRLPALAALEKPPGVYLSVGDDDYFGLWRGSLALFRDLRDAGLQAELRVVEGGHVWPLWKREIEGALRFIGRYLEGP